MQPAERFNIWKISVLSHKSSETKSFTKGLAIGYVNITKTMKTVRVCNFNYSLCIVTFPFLSLEWFCRLRSWVQQVNLIRKININLQFSITYSSRNLPYRMYNWLWNTQTNWEHFGWVKGDGEQEVENGDSVIVNGKWSCNQTAYFAYRGGMYRKGVRAPATYPFSTKLAMVFTWTMRCFWKSITRKRGAYHFKIIAVLPTILSWIR